MALSFFFQAILKRGSDPQKIVSQGVSSTGSVQSQVQHQNRFGLHLRSSRHNPININNPAIGTLGAHTIINTPGSAYSINLVAMQQPPQVTPSPSPHQLQQSQTGNPSGSIPQQPQNMTPKVTYGRRPRRNQLKIVNPDTINAAGAVSIVSDHLFDSLFDGLELSKHLSSLFSKQGIEDCFLFFSYCIGLMCRFVAFMLLKYQVRPSQTSKVIL